MAVTLDTKSLFNQEAFSDITIKFSGREAKCHKIVLCSNSEYFNTMCGPGSNFAETRQPTIELQDDDPDAVLAMLRHLYGFEYLVPTKPTGLQTVQYHISVSLVSQKYLLPKLKESALEAVHASRASIEVAYGNPQDTTELIELLELLMTHTDGTNGFDKMLVQVATPLLPKLMAKKDFRAMIEREDCKPLLRTVLKTVDRGHTSLQGRSSATDVSTCLQCSKSMLLKIGSTLCPDCGRQMVYTKWA